MDGARIFNALVETNISPARYIAACDSMSVCLSKGLAAPIGSMIVGSTEFITQAKRVRKSLGGGMRQVGVIAAAGIVALNTMVERLKQDHIHAKQLSTSISNMHGLSVSSIIETNIVFWSIDSTLLSITAASFRDLLKEQDIWCVATETYKLRFVLHYMITETDVQKVIQVTQNIVNKYKI
jgi:threonine aldolase